MRAKAPCVSLAVFLVSSVLISGQTLPAAGGVEAKSTGASAAPDYAQLARRCADTLKQSPDGASGRACAASLQPHLAEVVRGANALLGAGEFTAALDRCAAVLVIDWANKEAGTCASTALARMAAHELDQLRLEQALAAVEKGDSARAGELIDELHKSEFGNILRDAIKLQRELNRSASARADAAGTAAIEHARLLGALGKQDEAVALLREVMTSNVGQRVREEARQALDLARPTLRRSFVETLRNPWTVHVFAVLLVVASAWIVLHWTRDIWRWVDRQFLSGVRRRSWKFAGVSGDDALGARDPILDALRRVPHEVRKPIWTPTRLTLFPHGADGWEVWEDFCIEDAERAKVVHEDVFDPRMSHSDGDRALNDAFQNLQFTVGPVGVGAVTKFWTGLVDWWHTGEPSFSATCHELPTSENTSRIVIRLTSNGPGGTASVLASSDRDGAADSVALCAERAAYKLLFTMSEHRDSAAQIDAHAAFRQGVTKLSWAVRAASDADKDRAQRSADILKAIHNLEIARRSFEREADHRVYHLQALRFLGIAYALVGHEAAARLIFEELEDATDRPPAPIATPHSPLRTGNRGFARLRRGTAGQLPTEPRLDAQAQAAALRRDQQLKAEAQFNQAMLYCHSIVRSNSRPLTALKFVDDFMESVAAKDTSLAVSVRVSRLLHRNNMCWRDWLSLDPSILETLRRELESAAALPGDLERLAANATGSDRRHYVVLASHARRNLAVAQLRFLALELPRRGPFAKDATPLTSERLTFVREALDAIDASMVLGELTPGAKVAQAYGLLLSSRWRRAEEIAELLTDDADKQFALYIAAEAALQRGDRAVAQARVKSAMMVTIENPALLAFVTDFMALRGDGDVRTTASLGEAVAGVASAISVLRDARQFGNEAVQVPTAL